MTTVDENLPIVVDVSLERRGRERRSDNSSIEHAAPTHVHILKRAYRTGSRDAVDTIGDRYTLVKLNFGERDNLGWQLRYGRELAVRVMAQTLA